MPILTIPTERPTSPEPDAVVEVNPDVVSDQPYKPSYKDNTMRSKDTDLNTLLQHVDGSPWSIDFYLGLQGSGQSNVGFTLDAVEGGLFQQYHRIRDLEVKVTSVLSLEHDTETSNTYYEGEAVLYARIIPNEGNVFLADIGNGRRVLFEITRAVPTSALKNTVYNISYRSKMEYSEDVRRVLDKSTVKTSVFVRDSLFGLSRGLFSSDEHSVYLESKTSLRRLHEVYGIEFYSDTNDTLLLRDEVYDPHVVYFMNHLPKDQLNTAQRYKELTIHKAGLAEGSLFTSLLGKYHPASKMMQRFKHVEVHSEYHPLIWGGIGVTMIDRYVTMDNEVTVVPDVVEPPESLPLYHALPEEYYVVTSNVYTYDKPTSVLERELLKFQHNQVIDLLAVSELAAQDVIDALTAEQRFYYIPLVVFLLSVVIREY